MIFSNGLLILSLFSVTGYSDNGQVPHTVVAVAGHSAILPCNVPTPLSTDEASLILWYRMDEPNPIYTLDVRNNVPIGHARHFPATEMTGRAYFNVSVHPPVLIIESANIQDKGHYKCRVDLKRSRTLILHSRLDIIVPPGEPILMDEYGQRLYGVVGPYDEGARLNLVCEVDGGDPLPSVTWWKGINMLDSSYDDTDQGFVRNEMVLEKIERHDWMSNYTCKASNTNTTRPKEASLQLDMNLSPLEVKILVPELPMRAGEEQGVVCQTRGSRPRALTSWWIDGTKLEGTSELLADDGNVTMSAVHFTPTSYEHRKKLVCKATNPALPKQTMQTEITLDVQFLPILNLTLGHALSLSRIKEGSNVYLECTVDANPPIMNMTWRFNDRPLTAYRTIGFVVLNRTLLLQRVRRAHAGNYSCHATNDVGKGSSDTLNIRVQYSPVCRYAEKRTYGVSVAEKLDLTCDVDADPLEVQFRWSLNGSLEIPREWINGSMLRYSPESGFGILSCWATNKVGAQKEPCQFMIVPAGNPEMPQNCSVTNQTSNSVSVGCRAGYDGGLPQVFHLEIYDSGSENLVANLTSADQPTFQVLSLSASTSYVLLVYASNGKGRSKSVALVASTLLSNKGNTGSDIKIFLNPLLVGFILIMIFVITSAIIIIIVKAKRKRNKADTDDKAKYEKEKKDLEESQEPGEKGPDIIPLSSESDVFYMGSVMRKKETFDKEDSPPVELIRKKYMHTVL